MTPTLQLADVLLPRTDAGVAAQFVSVITAAIVVAVMVRHERALVTLTTGVALMLLGLMGVRSLH